MSKLVWGGYEHDRENEMSHIEPYSKTEEDNDIKQSLILVH